ncbi:MAG TPA: hypothetical protein PKD85_07820 [Saprospiraceae bacterium]|nr:hypothetical protein [Saprospiraceae bacterium]
MEEEMKGLVQIYLNDSFVFPKWWSLIGPKNKEMLFEFEDANRILGTNRYDGRNMYVGEDELYRYYIIEYELPSPINTVCNVKIDFILSMIIKRVSKMSQTDLSNIELEAPIEIIYFF